jgi:hypothetical protein
MGSAGTDEMHYRVMSTARGQGMRVRGIIVLMAAVISIASAGEKAVVSLREFCSTELRDVGIEVQRPVTVHLRALGGGGDYGWTYKSDKMFAYGWIINAETRELVWRMDAKNSFRVDNDLAFDGTLTLQPGKYEVYFTAWGYIYHTTFSHIQTNIDRRRTPLFPPPPKKEGFFSWFSGWWSDDLVKEWESRCAKWGIDLLVDDEAAGSMRTFSPPLELSNVVLKAIGSNEESCIRKGFALSAPTMVTVYALGEGVKGQPQVDVAWIVDARDRRRVWEMSHNTEWAGGAKKNRKFAGTVDLDAGEYVLYYSTDDSHGPQDWNDEPPYDPLNWGVTLAIENEEERKNFKATVYNEDENIIISLIKVRDNEYRTAGFVLKRDCEVRVYAIGEKSNSPKQMADQGYIIDARTRARVWSMDLDRTLPAGGASKNRYIDEVITLPKGKYLAVYSTDDSHAYNAWNAEPPCDKERYGMTIMGVGKNFNPSIVGTYVEEKDESVIAQIIRPGNDEDRSVKFRLEKTTRVRVYAIGEGQNREMFDYGWIEDARNGNIVWEMTYAMTFHAGGGRKNRVVMTTLLLDRGEYRLRWRSDDSHSFNDWNVDPPDDQQFWGVTLYRDDGSEPLPPVPPAPPVPGHSAGVKGEED